MTHQTDQTHLLFVTIYGLVWSSSETLNIIWRWYTPICHWLHDITLHFTSLVVWKVSSSKVPLGKTFRNHPVKRETEEGYKMILCLSFTGGHIRKRPYSLNKSCKSTEIQRCNLSSSVIKRSLFPHVRIPVNLVTSWNDFVSIVKKVNIFSEAI